MRPRSQLARPESFLAREAVSRVLRLFLTIAMLARVLGHEIANAEPSSQTAPITQPPMQFVRVRSSNPACQPACAEWISAEGRIESGTAQSFAKVIAGLGSRRLPIFINSPGGSIADAMAMGRLIRAKRLAVAVARTRLVSCLSLTSECGEAQGTASSFEAVCASACPLVLAGGVERYASPLAPIGVHQVTLVVNKEANIRSLSTRLKEEITRTFLGEMRFETTTKEVAIAKVDSNIAGYLEGMGIGSPLMQLIRSTPATEFHRLTAQELLASRLITIWIDGSSAVVDGVGANGLAGVPVDPSSGHKAEITASGSWPFPLPASGREIALQATFTYRRGGGVVEATLKTRDSITNAEAEVRGRGFTLTLAPGGAEYHLLKPMNGDPIQDAMPLARFCDLPNQGRIVIEPFDGPATNIVESGASANPHEPPISIDINTAEGIDALFQEACPMPTAGRS